MPSIAIIVVVAVGFALLVVSIVLASAALSHLRRLTQSRESGVREAAELRARLDILAAQNVDFERDMRQDFANARTEQVLAAQAARTELGATLSHNAQTIQQQLTSMAGAQNEQWT